MRSVYLEKYDWDVSICDDVAPNNVRKLIPMLTDMGMSHRDIARILLLFDRPNRGFIYTDKDGRRSLIAIGWCMSWKQEINTLSHEIFHLAEHICKGCDMPTDGEPPAYVVGYLVDRLCD